MYSLEIPTVYSPRKWVHLGLRVLYSEFIRRLLWNVGISGSEYISSEYTRNVSTTTWWEWPGMSTSSFGPTRVSIMRISARSEASTLEFGLSEVSEFGLHSYSTYICVKYLYLLRYSIKYLYLYYIIWLFFLWRLLLRDWPHWHCTENHPFIEVWSFNATPPPHSHDVYPHLIMATCLYKSALLVAELDSCLHP